MSEGLWFEFMSCLVRRTEDAIMHFMKHLMSMHEVWKGMKENMGSMNSDFYDSMVLQNSYNK